MCGIIGYIGKNVNENLIDGLEKLEYRGYDSAGLCSKINGEFYVEKSLGHVERLKEKIKKKGEYGIGIAHTRWATHGEISIENCHPHFSHDADVALVHNGIIENFEWVRSELTDKGFNFYGQTDSEVVAKLLNGKITIKKMQLITEIIEGSYALAIISKKNDEIFFAKNKSPLYIARGEKCVIVASDISCFEGKVHEFYSLEDGEFGKVSLNTLEFYNREGLLIEKLPQKLDENFDFSVKENYDFYMLKEIEESDGVVRNIIENYQKDDIKARLDGIKTEYYKRIYLVGCGTAYHACLVGEAYLKARFKLDVYAKQASEFPYQNNVIDENTLCIFVSQSGETADTISALEYAKNMRAKTLSVVNVLYSTIAKKSDIVLPIFAGQEKAVASTKAYLGQCLVLYILANSLAQIDYLSKFESFGIDFGNDAILKELTEYIASKDKMFFIGRGLDYITALEASLKLKEITYIFSSAEPSGELKHGTLALVHEGMPVVVIANDEECFNKTLNNAYEVKSRGGRLTLVSSLEIDDEIKENFDYIIKIKKSNKELSVLQTIVTLQKLAYFVAVQRECNPDKPRNLAKSVTVE